MCLSPLFVWLTLHIDDGLFRAIVDSNPQLVTGLARLHDLAASFLAQHSKPLNKLAIPTKPGDSRLDEHDRQADRELRLLELMGTTLLFEENHLVGFLPLRSYLENKKQLGAGKKCPPEEEEIVRCLLLRDSLERLKCTKADIGDRCDNVTVKTEKDSIAASSSNAADLFAQIDSQDQTSEPLMQHEKPMIVIDAQNVAMRHG